MIKGFRPFSGFEKRREEKRSGAEQTEIKNIKAALYSLSILKKHRIDLVKLKASLLLQSFLNTAAGHS